MSPQHVVSVSVKELVEFSLRSGDLESSFTGISRTADAVRSHRVLQESRRRECRHEGEYLAEVPVSARLSRKRFILEVSGRIDGVLLSNNGVVIEEIKTTVQPLDAIGEETFPLHWAQAQCYAFMYGSPRGARSVDVWLTYYHLDTGETKSFTRRFDMTALGDFFAAVVDDYGEWAERLRDWGRVRDRSVKKLPFPFPAYRAGQEEFASAVLGTIEEAGLLFAQAPTGIGKTMSTLYPAVKSLGGGACEKLFYLTAKTVTRRIAENAIGKMRERGLRLKTVTVTAKEKICFAPEAECTPEECPFAKGYYDRLRVALRDAFEEEALVRPAIEGYARRHSLCPFEFSLDLSLWADCIICDYNYVFDPRVYLRRFFQESEGGSAGDYVFLVDEAHNLVDRSREMFSAEVSRDTFLALRRSLDGVKRPSRRLKAPLTRLNAALDEVTGYLRDARRRIDEEGRDNALAEKEPPEKFLPLLASFLASSEELLISGEELPSRDALLERYFEAYGFLRTADGYDERYVTCYLRSGNDVTVRLFCLDPSRLLKEALARGKAAVLFSATLSPLDYFVRVLGGDEGTRRLLLPSPFPRENLCVLVDERVSTKYHVRHLTYERIARDLAAFVSGKVGNYLVYFPSYRYLEEVRAAFTKQNPGIRTLSQTSGMKEDDRQRFLDEFSSFGGAALVGFAVMGGVFGEGIDLVGERLSGVAVVGVGLPLVGFERELIRQYYADTIGQGFEYAYLYPGMNKVMQAGGRVIRSETDRGVLLLIDERFIRPPYPSLFPGEWRPVRRVRNPGEISSLVAAFWRKGDGTPDPAAAPPRQ